MNAGERTGERVSSLFLLLGPKNSGTELLMMMMIQEGMDGGKDGRKRRRRLKLQIMPNEQSRFGERKKEKISWTTIWRPSRWLVGSLIEPKKFSFSGTILMEAKCVQRSNLLVCSVIILLTGWLCNLRERERELRLAWQPLMEQEMEKLKSWVKGIERWLLFGLTDEPSKWRYTGSNEKHKKPITSAHCQSTW